MDVLMIVLALGVIALGSYLIARPAQLARAHRESGGDTRAKLGMGPRTTESTRTIQVIGGIVLVVGIAVLALGLYRII